METSQQKKAGRALPSVFFTIFLDVLGVGVLIPVLPSLLLPGPHRLVPADWSVAHGLILLGWLTAIYPLMQFFATPILGQMSDKFGRRKILSLSLLGTAVGYALFAIGIITKNLPLVFFARALDGITGGNLSVAQAVIADVTPPEKRTRNFGLVGAMFGIGFVLGPYIGAKLASPGLSFYGLFTTPHWFGPAIPFWFTAALSVLNTLLIFVRLPETNQHIERDKKLHLTKSVHNIINAATMPGLRVIFPSIFLYWSGFTFFTTFFQVVLLQKLHFGQSNVGDYFAYIGIWIALTQVIITPNVAKYLKNYQVIRFSMIGTAVGLLLTLFARNTTELLLFTPIFAIFNGQTIANTTALVSSSVSGKIQGEVLGINASVQALSQAIPAALAGYIASIGINTPVLVGSGVMALGWLLFWILYRPSRHYRAPANSAAMPAGH